MFSKHSGRRQFAYCAIFHLKFQDQISVAAADHIALFSTDLPTFFGYLLIGPVSWRPLSRIITFPMKKRPPAYFRRSQYVVGGRWSVVGGVWWVVGGRWSVVGGRWSVVGGTWWVVGGRW